MKYMKTKWASSWHSFFGKVIVRSMGVEEHMDKRVRNVDVQNQQEGVSKTTTGGMHPKFDIKSFLDPGDDGFPEGPQTIAAKTLVGCVCSKCAGSEGRWHPGGQRSSQRWRS